MTRDVAKTKKGVRRASQQEPSTESLREMPEVDLTDGTWRPNPYAARIATEGMTFPAHGHPRTRQEVGDSVLKSFRLPAKLWKQVVTIAQAK